MKINQFRPSGVNPYQSQQNKLNQIDSIKQKKTDVVEISSAAKEMQSLSSIEKERQAKVEELKSQIENGTYTIQPSEIAKKMLDFYKG